MIRFLAGGALVLVLTLAGCSSGPNLAQDQAAVDQWQSKIASVQSKLGDAEQNLRDIQSEDLTLDGGYLDGGALGLMKPPCQDPSVFVSDSWLGPECTPAQTKQVDSNLAAANARESKPAALIKALEAVLSTDKFNLQVAQDQLRKDENG